MIRIGTQQVGNKLVRLFGEGQNVKRVVSEVIDGKTITSVFDINGNHLTSRAKQFSAEAIGNKVIKTKKETFLYGGFNPSLTKRTDEVYNGYNYLGKRIINEFESGTKTVTKQKADTDFVVKKRFYDNGFLVDRRVLNKDFDTLFSMNRANNKGLIIPNDVTASDAKNMSIKEMRNKLFVENPNDSSIDYIDSFGACGLEKLNVVDSDVIMAPMKNIDETIKGLFDHLG